MEGIIKSIKCDPAIIEVDADDQIFSIRTVVFVDADVNTMYKACVDAGFDPADVAVSAADGETTLAALKESGVSSVTYSQDVGLGSND